MKTQAKENWFAITALSCWALCAFVVSGTLMAGHWITLPKPELTHAQWTALLPPNKPDDTASWHAFHFLYSDCPCSMRILDELLDYPPNTSVNETLILIGESVTSAEAAATMGYSIKYTTPEKLEEDFGIEAAPLLIVISDQQALTYVGGYTSRKQSLNSQHREVISRCHAGDEVDSLPLYGCAVSSALKDLVDPLRLKTSLKF